MNFNLLIRITALAALLVLSTVTSANSGHLVQSLKEFDAAVAQLQAGDEIILANGLWNDVELVFHAKGTAKEPVRLSAEEPGKVIISGESNLALSGEHIIVSGLVFKNGFTPTSEVIAFRTSKERLANNTRVTNTVIDSFSNPERHSSDTWVAIYGKNNHFDHNSLINKGNRGVTLAVKMNTRASQENGHIIERNYFGPRQTLGSNGGETLRIGTSHYSREYSNTTVRENYFDRTGGELEIISSKSCGNEIRDNVFFESQGTLTMRHGHHTLVENNYFLGNRKPNTGGIRVINGHQTVRNNYMYGLTGHRFFGALVVMNGIPNGPINRYDPVIESTIERNIIIDSDHIQLCAGADEERSQAPSSTSIAHNVIMTKTNLSPFTIYDDISGIAFSDNAVNKELDVPIANGFSPVNYSASENDHGLQTPDSALLEDTGFDTLKLPIEKMQTGADFYPKREVQIAFRSGREIPVAPGTNTLLAALKLSRPGDVLVLDNDGEYLLTKYAHAKHTVSIVALPGGKPMIRSEKGSFFLIQNGGALELDNLWIDGAESPDTAGNSVISTDRYAMNQNYSLIVRNTKVTNLDVNHSFNFLKVYRSTFADRIEIRDSVMENITGNILALDTETDDLGIYNAENVTITNSRFANIEGAIANIYRGGTDESTFGPIVNISGNEIDKVGHGKRNKSASSMRFHGVQRLTISDTTWESSAPIDLHMTVNGEPITRFNALLMKSTKEIRANSPDFEAQDVVYQ